MQCTGLCSSRSSKEGVQIRLTLAMMTQARDRLLIQGAALPKAKGPGVKCLGLSRRKAMGMPPAEHVLSDQLSLSSNECKLPYLITRSLLSKRLKCGRCSCAGARLLMRGHRRGKIKQADWCMDGKTCKFMRHHKMVAHDNTRRYRCWQNSDTV